MQTYEEKLHSNNISLSFQSFIEDKLGSEEIELQTVCQLTKSPLTIPIRHVPISNINCIFDKSNWLEFYQTIQNNDQGVKPQGFACPGCKKNVYSNDFGIDFHLYQILEYRAHYKTKNPNHKVDDRRLFYQHSSNSYYVYCSVYEIVNKNKNIKQKKGEGKFKLPSSKEISSFAKRKYNTQIKLNPQNEKIYYEIASTIMRLQKFMNSRIYQISLESGISHQLLQQKLTTHKQELKLAFKNSLKLVSLGKQSLKNDYIFSLKKFAISNKIQSYLLVYYVQYGVWQEFALILQNQPYVQLELALYIKGDQKDKNEIFIIGGQKQERFQQSNQFIRITFPNNPFLDKFEAIMEELPPLPLAGYQYIGVNYQDNIFIFYGQKQFITNQKLVKTQPLNAQYVFRKLQRNWEQMKNPLTPRYDGSYFTLKNDTQDKMLVLFGGVVNEPQGLPNYKTTEQDFGQIFICKDQKFFGQQLCQFKINCLDKQDYTKFVLSYPILSCPYYGNQQLILSGEALRYQNIAQGQVFSFDWAEGNLKLNEFFSLEPPSQILMPYKKQTVYDIFTPVHDVEGVIAYGNFYTIYHHEQNLYEENQRVITSLLRFNLANGLFFSEPYIDNQISKQTAQNILDSLENREDVVL